MRSYTLSFLFSLFTCLSFAQVKVDVDANRLLVPIQPTMYGIFFEDINFAADGGLYAELVKNRSFEFEYPWMGWKHVPEAETRYNTRNELTIFSNAKANPTNPKVVRVEKRDGSQVIGFQNEGFDGMGFKQGAAYDFSAKVRLNKGNIGLRVQLLDAQGAVLQAQDIQPNGTSTWTSVETTLISPKTVEKGKLQVLFLGEGQLDIDVVSLFPQDTWKGRKKGLRKDLVQMLADLKPGFIRFPGGCVVEGRTLAERYQWKKTLGVVENREILFNRWNKEFSHRPAPDYFQSFGIGFFEYFQLCSDIGAKPVPILSCGLACQFNSSEMQPLEDMEPFIQDALDLIEFANGSVDSPWGAIRASMGHPEPFGLEMIGVGNEQWGEEYFERYDLIAQAIQAKYPAIQIISGTGPFAEGELFDLAEKELTKRKPALVDEHYYKPPQWFLDNASRYDIYDRNRYKIFAGEYAAHPKGTERPESRNNWEAALSEAAFMTGLERNADVVYMTSYAPLLAHVNKWQWNPDLIWFDNLQAIATPSYYVQQLYANNAGTHTLPITADGNLMVGQKGLYGTAAWDAKTKEIILKLVNTGTAPATLNLQMKGISKNSIAQITILQADQLEQFNSLEKPNEVKPSASTWEVKRGTLTLGPRSFQVIRIKK